MRTTLIAAAAAVFGMTGVSGGAEAQPWGGYYRPYPPPFYRPGPFLPFAPFYRPRVFYPPPVYPPPVYAAPPVAYAPPYYAPPYYAPRYEAPPYYDGPPSYVAPRGTYRGRVVQRRVRRAAQPVAAAPNATALRPAPPTTLAPLPETPAPAAPPINAYPPERTPNP